MSAAGGAAAVPSRIDTLDSLLALYRVLLRTQISVPRLLGIGALGALSLVLGLFARSDSDSAQAAADVVSGYGLGLLVPLATVWLGTSAIGDLVEDRLLVYLSLKPVPRWQLPAAAILATLTIILPLTAVPLTLSTFVAGAREIAWATLLAALLAALAYAGLFVAAGLWFRRAIWWGLAFVLIWENAAAYLGGAGRFTVIGWASSLLGLAPGIEVQLEAGPPAVACILLPAIAIAGWLAATWRYRRADID
jgi:ABC-2 type transport system permease protein